MNCEVTMSMTTFFTPASTAKELAEALLLTSSPSAASSSASVDDDADLMMLDFDVDDDALLPSPTCLMYPAGRSAGHFWLDQRPSLDLITGNSDALSSAVLCFIRNFVW